jgi:hypothetical protein
MFDDLVAALWATARADRDGWERDGWARAAAAVAGQAAPFLDWARGHRRWRFVVAEAADAVCAKPPEAAAWVAHAIVDELLEEETDISPT